MCPLVLLQPQKDCVQTTVMRANFRFPTCATATLPFASFRARSLTRSPSQSTKTYKRTHGKVSYTLAATVKGIGSVPVGGVLVYLQRSTNGKTGWKNSGAVMSSNAAGRVSRAFTSKKRSTYYYRWSVPAQTGVLVTPSTSKQKIVVK